MFVHFVLYCFIFVSVPFIFVLKLTQFFLFLHILLNEYIYMRMYFYDIICQQKTFKKNKCTMAMYMVVEIFYYCMDVYLLDDIGIQNIMV